MPPIKTGSSNHVQKVNVRNVCVAELLIKYHHVLRILAVKEMSSIRHTWMCLERMLVPSTCALRIMLVGVSLHNAMGWGKREFIVNSRYMNDCTIITAMVGWWDNRPSMLAGHDFKHNISNPVICYTRFSISNLFIIGLHALAIL